MPATISSSIRTVFFDAVGTLLFPEPPAAEHYAAVAARHGLALSPEDIQERFHTAYRAEEDADRLAGWMTSEVREVMRWRRIVTESLAGVNDPDTCFRELFDHFSHANAWRVYPRADTLFAALRGRGILLGLGSNYDARLWSAIGGLPELASLRERVVISAAVGFRKPSAMFFDAVVRRAACEPGEVLFVGDDYDNDYEGARRAGLNAIHFDPNGKNVLGACRVADLFELLN